jgi:hypothetical protein
MTLLRTIPGFTRLLVGLFLAAQFAGIVLMPPANAVPAIATQASHDLASHTDEMDAAAHHHAHPQGKGHSMPCGHHNDGGNPVNTCCALHACFAGLLPPAVAIAAETAAGEPLTASPDNVAHGAPGGRLDRPPRHLP